MKFSRPNRPLLSAARWLPLLTFVAFSTGIPLSAQQAAKPAAKPEAAPAPADDSVLPEIVVSAPKLAGDLLKLPLSATVTTGNVIEENAIRTVKDAAIYSPNTFFTEFSARKTSNPRFRGIGASPTNPGVTTYLDGVPQFNGNSSSIELLDVEQIDFVRGPAGALFGRNTVGGLINITSRKPSLDAWHGGLESTFGNYNLFDYRGNVTGPLIKDQLGFSFAGGYNERDGYTHDQGTGNDVDSRRSWFGKTQFLWTPSDDLEVRLILQGESANDGDYALNDLGALRNNPRRTNRDLLGFTERDLFMPTLQVTYHADAFDFTSTTGMVWFQTHDFTDLDYTNLTATDLFFILPVNQPSFLIRDTREEQRTWTQEFRFSNPADSPIVLGEHASLAWQAGLFLFYNEFEQQVTRFQDNAFAPGPIFLPQSITASDTKTRDMGAGIFLQSTLTLWDRLDFTAGVRWDYEDKEADLLVNNSLAPLTGVSNLDGSFSKVTPQAALTYRISPNLATYASFSGGYKAGGFNAGVGAGGPQAYEDEQSYNYELGIKGRALDDRLNFSAAFFYTDWKDLQLNVPAGIADYRIVNAGNAASKGIELAANFRPVQGWDIFGSAGWQDARFLSGSVDNGANVSGNQLPYTPDYTATVGSQLTFNIGHGYSFYARGDVQFIGSFNYDTVNGAAQDAYTIANVRVGVRNQSWFIEGFVNNAFDTEYVPIAIPFPGLAPSGYIGESGSPVTFGVRVGVKF